MTMMAISINVFDDEGNVVGETNVDMTQEQISDVISHAAQLISVHRSGRCSRDDIDGIISELEDALTVYGLVQDLT